MSEQAIEKRAMLDVEDMLPRPAADLDTLKRIRNEWDQYLASMLKKDVDYYRLDGMAKDGLSKAGAENLIKSAGYAATDGEFLEKTEKWDYPPFLAYTFRVDITSKRTGKIVGFGIGEANSHEKKYRWRWVKRSEVPAIMEPSTLVTKDGTISEPKFAVERGTTTGQYGKPMEHWQAFRTAMQDGTAREVKKVSKGGKEIVWVEIGSLLYRIPNDDVGSIRNTLMKMSKKRALVDGALTATGMSDRFTQYEDDEDHTTTENHSEPIDVTPEPPKDTPPKLELPPVDSWKEAFSRCKTLDELKECWEVEQKRHEEYSGEEQTAIIRAKDVRKVSLQESHGTLV